MAKSKKNYTHQVIYSENNHLVVTTPKGWAREHQSVFPDFDFKNDNVPRTSRIEKHLASLKFKKAVSKELVIYYKFKE